MRLHRLHRSVRLTVRGMGKKGVKYGYYGNILHITSVWCMMCYIPM